MKKRYCDELAEWVKEKKSTQRDKNLVMFLAVKNEVEEALDEGYPVKTVWEHMYATKRISIGYDSFLNYTNRQIRKSANKPHTTTPSPVNNKMKKTTVAHEVTTVKTDPTKPRGFFINSSPNKEDLI